MKKLEFLLFFLCYSFLVCSQTYNLNFDAEVLKNYKIFKAGTKIHVISMDHKLEYNSFYKLVDTYTLNTDCGSVRIAEKLEKVLDVDYKSLQNFWDVQIIFNVLEELSKKGTQTELRAEMEADVLEYINHAQNNGLEFNDPYLETYLYGIITKLAPTVLIDGRPGNVNLLILSDATVNAAMYPNGTLVITTGLISLLHSEDELAAVLAHEIAHFVLDHSVQNLNKITTRQKRAEFWAGLATTIAAVAEGAAANRNHYYKPGAATVAVASVSAQIAALVCERLGMKYSQEQESEADRIAVELMKVVGYDSNALATALSRLEENMKEERSVDMYFASNHPALVDRIEQSGTPNKIKDRNFEKIISFAVSDAASMKMQDRRFRQALPLFSQNITNNVASADDYIQKANCLLFLNSDAGSYDEVATLLNNAKNISPDNINIYKTEILSMLRQKKYKEASTLLSNYNNKITDMLQLNTKVPGEVWSRAFNFARTEQYWINNMSIKLKAF